MLKAVRDDLALYGRGVALVRLANEDRLGFEHVDRKDFLCEAARKWMEVGAGRAARMADAKAGPRALRGDIGRRMVAFGSTAAAGTARTPVRRRL